jgi:hypothetical protein
LLTDELEEIAAYFDTFLHRDNILNHSARHKAEAYLTLGKKERAMQDVLPDAQKIVSQPPFPSLPQAMVQLLAAKILTITVGEAQDFLLGNALRPTTLMPAAAPAAPTPLAHDALATSKPAHRPRLATPKNSPTTAAEPPAPVVASSTPSFILQRPKAGFRAQAQWLPTGTMRVLVGPTAAGSPTSSLSKAGQQLRQHLLDTGVLRPHEQQVRFAQDYEFDSPNRAAEIVCGGAVNARIAWLAPDGQTLGSYLAGLATG